ncbi:M48 family metalloprotease [Aporhodopirellula aestuarii]|uniref:M48 family metalloprotease n=1 Tax=Aporhodopirellula aestuarii TaxID=2950107 RepID=A0ABT0TXM9_9BACT|nr:M48 family metalloprotease [Aporhodopirellula aestuarii]MCM2369352.1 M48 family metalloprotease [Aporhodopirellula aestuarii]
MSIRFQCPKCEKVLRVGDEHAGKVAKCSGCQTKLRVPAAKSKTVKPKSSQTKHSPEQQPAEGDSLFSELPEFQTFDQPVEKPRGVDDDFRDALAAGTQTHFSGETSPLRPSATGFANSNSPAAAGSTNFVAPAAGVTPPTPNNAGLDDIGDVLGAMQATVASAVQQQRRTNALSNAPKTTVEQVKQAFDGELQDFDRSEGVKAQAFFVAISMVLLPIAFVTFVLVFTAAMIALPMNALPISFATFMTYGGLILYPLMWVLLFALWIPVFSLIGAVISMVFSGAADDDQTRVLTREDQPVMYEFVSQICEKVGAPTPARIDLDSNFNASASFRNGWMSFGKNELVLKLGVPLIASQSAEQLGSVIAHEFGHFRQGSAMRSTYLVRSLTGWFFEKAFLGQLRADLIEYYQDAEESNDSFLAVISFIGWLGRKIMLCFGYTGHALAGSLSREMEFDADRHAVHLAGTKSFIQSMANVERFGVAHGVTIENLRMLYLSSGVLVDNIPRFMIYIGETMSNGVIQRIAQEKQREKQERFDTHPPTRERVAAAKEINQAGLLHMQRPASDLVRNWQSVCELTTLDFYGQVIGKPVEKSQTTKLENVLKAEHKLLLDRKKA